MPTGTVTAVKAQAPWSGNHGAFIDYTIDLESGGRIGEVKITSKCNSDGSAMKPPTVGETFEYEVKSNDQHGIKIKRVSQQGGGGPSGNGRAPASNPEREKSIERQVAAKAAARVLAAMVASGANLPDGEARRLTDLFYDAIQGESEAAPQVAPPVVEAPTADYDDEGIPF